MIFVDRAHVSAPAVLDKRYSDGKTETQRAIAHYDNWNGSKQFDFKRYKEDEVKDALDRLFSGKCAYCESKFDHVCPEDIEHWRPKGAVVLANGTTKKPGYYWLAATWSNLLPSCIDCNRRRRQDDVRNSAKAQSGKENLFPVADESKRWLRHSDENLEIPLLLDPCADDPADHLVVDEHAVVNERMPHGTLQNQKARTSIDVFGLNRSSLVARRKEHHARILALFFDIRIGIDHFELLPQAKRAETREWLRDKLRQLKAERAESSEYLLMKSSLIHDFVATVGPQLQQLGLG